MPGAVAAVASVVGSVAGAVASTVGPIVGAIGAVLAPAIGAIGSVIGAITGALGGALAPIVNTIGGIGSWILTSVGQTTSGLVNIIGSTVKPLTTTLGQAIEAVARPVYVNTVRIVEVAGRVIQTGIEIVDAAVRPILQPIEAGLKAVKGALDKVGQWVNTAFHPSARMSELIAQHPELWEMSEGYTSSFLTLLQSDGIITATEAALLTLPDVIQTINQVATLKVLSDLVKGQASVSELIGRISEGKGFETAQAIAILSKSIAETTIGIMDRVDTDVTILRASIDKFDETLEASLDKYAAETKADILSAVTPRLDVLGRYQVETNRRIAAIVRHIDDRAWFVAMLMRVLPR